MNFIDALCSGIKPAPDYTVSQWADNFRVLPTEGSVEPGRYRTDRTPYCREIMDALSVYSGIDDVSVMKATQIGLTEAGINFFAYIVDTEPGPILMVLPTDKLAADHSAAKIGPTIDETPELSQRIAPKKVKTAGNKIDRKKFPGGILFICGANSPANYRNKSIRYLILDDLDGFPAVVGDEGDPADLAEKRTDSYSARKKIFRNSTPTIKGVSKIEKHFLASDQRKYYVPCPFCGSMQTLEWGGKSEKFGLKFKRDNSGNIIATWYKCRACGEAIDESYKPEMLAKGEWRAKYPDRKKRGYKISSLYSPLGWVSWEQIANEFLQAKDSPERLQVWTNTRLADVWDQEGSQPDWILLKNRAEAFRLLRPPKEVCFLSAGVDVQANRLPVIVRGWGENEQSWLVLYTELFGDPNQDEVWQQLDFILMQKYETEDGFFLPIKTMAVDSGYLSNIVYNYCRQRPLNCIAIKGMQGSKRDAVLGSPTYVDVDWQGQKIKDGCQLWPVSTDPAKDSIYARLAMSKIGPGFYHFPIGIDDKYYLQLTAEKKITKYRNGFPIFEWAKIRERNDVLDAEVYALAAAIRAGMYSISDWQKVRSNQIGKNAAKVAPQAKPKRQTLKPKRW